MRVVQVSKDTNNLRRRFFRLLFGDNRGYLFLATLDRNRNKMSMFFPYPDHLDAALEWVNRNHHGRSIYFCPVLFRTKRFEKGEAEVTQCLWADLDEADPDEYDPKPSIVLETSPGRFHGFWLLEHPVNPVIAESCSRKLAYMHPSADKTGWDMVQWLRVPITYNMKYEEPRGTPVVRLVTVEETRYDVNLFEGIRVETDVPDVPMPNVNGKDADQVLHTFRHQMSPSGTELYNMKPQGDWSTALWALEMQLIETGMTREDVFVVCKEAACNKFKRDNLPDKYLWQDVCRAWEQRHAQHVGFQRPYEVTDLLDDDERALIKTLAPSFVDRYVEWARSKGDAAWQYHEAGALTVLSAVLSEAVRLSTSYGIIVPNLWFMLLADTTLTRKSTAMDMAMELLIDAGMQDMILATDGSIEGLMQGISMRACRSSIFWRDEFSGLLAAINKKDYYAGMVETLTKLYDGKYQKRVLRREVIEVKDPILILLCGGIRTRILELMDEEYIISGFVPRFIFISAQPDIQGLRPIGPLTQLQDQTRVQLVRHIQNLYVTYDKKDVIKIGDQEVATRRLWDVQLGKDVWDRYNDFERAMLLSGTRSDRPEIYTPVFDRLAKSGLKIAMLLAAERCAGRPAVTVEMGDLLRAIAYVEGWRVHTEEVVVNIGKTVTEKRVDQIFKAITNNPGVMRSKLMQWFHLTARDAEWILTTLEQRGLVQRNKYQRTEKLYSAVAKGKVM